MSRSLHTQKLACRAIRRLTYPYATRLQAGARLSGNGGRARSITPTPAKAESYLPIHIQLHIQCPAPGSLHPLRPADITEMVSHAGYAPFYGLKSIRMRHECGLQAERLVFAEYIVSSEIHLYSVPLLPWHLPFYPAETDIAVFTRYGARCRQDVHFRGTVVDWTLAGLRNFYLIEVLAHELGHHLLQYNRGKRQSQVCRRRDHEERADLESRRIYRLFTNTIDY